MGRDATDNLSAAFATATADTTGKDERAIRRAAARGEALGHDLGAVTGMSLDKGVELDALAKPRKGVTLFIKRRPGALGEEKSLPRKLMELPLYRRPVE